MDAAILKHSKDTGYTIVLDYRFKDHQHEEFLKLRQVLLGKTNLSQAIPVEASTIPYVGEMATINCIVITLWDKSSKS